MKFLKRFKELNESNDRQGVNVYYYYTQQDETYGYINFTKTDDHQDIFPDDSPGRYGTDENREESEKILAKQTDGEWDEDYDYDYEEEEYVAWCDAKIEESIEKYLQTDLWGSVYLVVVKDDGFDDHYESTEVRDGEERMKTKEEFEKEILNTHESILAWADVTDVYENEDSDEGLISLFNQVYEKEPTKAGKIFLGLSGRQQRMIKGHFEERGELEFLDTLIAGSEFGLF